jgi:uncharacterized protein (DUF2164 family)
MTNKQIIQFDEFTREQLIYALKKYAMKELELDLEISPLNFYLTLLSRNLGLTFTIKP